MGSLTSRPKVPKVQSPQIVYMPAPVTNLPTGNDNNAQNAGQEEAAMREKNLLTASRSRLGTVTTSFRGLLGLANTSGQRKTLLGE